MAHYPVNHHLRHSYRLLALAAGCYLALAGVVGLIRTWGDPFLHRGDDWSLGLRVNPAGSWFALLAGLAVFAAAALGGNLHHRVNMALGWALLAIAMVVMAVIRTDANVLNVSMVNVIVLTVLGLVVLTAALYGKVGAAERAQARRPVAYRPYD